MEMGDEPVSVLPKRNGCHVSEWQSLFRSMQMELQTTDALFSKPNALLMSPGNSESDLRVEAAKTASAKLSMSKPFCRAPTLG